MGIRKYMVGAANRDNGEQMHVHEVQGTTEIASDHTHRFVGVTGEMVSLDARSHEHEFRGMTDYVRGHYHKVYVKTGAQKLVSDDEHVHYAEGETSFNHNHKHSFEMTTMMAMDAE
ncbi:MAG: YmaF family protein [Solirubrobacterales bacterium]